MCVGSGLCLVEFEKNDMSAGAGDAELPALGAQGDELNGERVVVGPALPRLLKHFHSL